ncbi:isoprenylcysteine carboxyl methyltransferase family protein [Diaminobutyricibacter tongyongensis]|uniref:Isoprenylcysteine carboxyl methyltransferase family protein n=1 Tax=Leifsonia tongyongensis TaxID=1268043 RepID=A0A6L9XW49_9MICO|nr:isoprenylcysteine carboxyl methyltransferase family protein [Diaminobutyricibacter tongyongensis]NEN05516.1 isoprenylcysteine carboxyl methyltransferase family protein [Diaminobutyricibacter tongyongensis]
MIWYTVLILATGLERILEMIISTRNAKWSFARGGVEYGRRHFAPMIALHVGFLLACLAEVWIGQRPFIPWLGWPMLVLVFASQALRYWCIAVLGPRWNTRVIVVPGLPLVDRGPYRWFKHPNYVAVVVEGIALPLIYTGWITALTFTVLNAVLLLRFRLPCEDTALASLPPATDHATSVR